jgi:hypothetical protein
MRCCNEMTTRKKRVVKWMIDDIQPVLVHDKTIIHWHDLALASSENRACYTKTHASCHNLKATGRWMNFLVMDHEQTPHSDAHARAPCIAYTMLAMHWLFSHFSYLSEILIDTKLFRVQCTTFSKRAQQGATGASIGSQTDQALIHLKPIRLRYATKGERCRLFDSGPIE